MPIYEYRCKDCNHQFEALLLSKEPEPTECPACQSHEVARKVSASSFQLNGTGWYQTDYAGTPSAPASAAPEPAAASSHVHSGGCGCCAAGSCAVPD